MVEKIYEAMPVLTLKRRMLVLSLPQADYQSLLARHQMHCLPGRRASKLCLQQSWSKAHADAAAVTCRCSKGPRTQGSTSGPKSSK